MVELSREQEEQARQEALIQLRGTAQKLKETKGNISRVLPKHFPQFKIGLEAIGFSIIRDENEALIDLMHEDKIEIDGSREGILVNIFTAEYRVYLFDRDESALKIGKLTPDQIIKFNTLIGKFALPETPQS